jgi:hypothetical protein
VPGHEGPHLERVRELGQRFQVGACPTFDQ